jgi:AIG2-like family.
MATLRYFAYGSNMLRERLVARVSTAQAVAVGVVREYRLDFAKVSVDGSGKGDMLASPGDEVWGVLYEFDASQKADLDAHEGRHYQAQEIVVSTADGDQAAMGVLGAAAQAGSVKSALRLVSGTDRRAGATRRLAGTVHPGTGSHSFPCSWRRRVEGAEERIGCAGSSRNGRRAG